MEKVYIILEDNGYDAVYPPNEFMFYLTEADAQKDANALNKIANGSINYFSVQELALKKQWN